MKKDKVLKIRKKPAQRRSKETVEDIFNAAAQVFAEKGYAQTTTDRIAEKAGISIGSLYQYFPNKDSIMVGIIERHIEEMKVFVDEIISQIQGPENINRQMIRNFTDLMLEHHDQEPELHRVLFEESPLPHSVKVAVNHMEEWVAKGFGEILRKSSNSRVKNPELAIRVVVRTIEALTHWYVLDTNEDISRNDFIDELVDMISGYLLISK